MSIVDGQQLLTWILWSFAPFPARSCCRWASSCPCRSNSSSPWRSPRPGSSSGKGCSWRRRACRLIPSTHPSSHPLALRICFLAAETRLLRATKTKKKKKPLPTLQLYVTNTSRAGYGRARQRYGVLARTFHRDTCRLLRA